MSIDNTLRVGFVFRFTDAEEARDEPVEDPSGGGEDVPAKDPSGGGTEPVVEVGKHRPPRTPALTGPAAPAISYQEWLG